MADASEEHPFGIINVGIFGEGVDAPSLSAVGFLEPRKSPVDVIQAVGRVMRRSPSKKLGYIICPILIPRKVDAESWLSNSSPDHGWQELGQILRALRAHDQRIEDNLSELMEVYLPNHADEVATLIAIGGADRRTRYWGHFGKPKTAVADLKRVLLKQVKPSQVFEDQEKFWQSSGKFKMEPENIISGLRLANTGRVSENTIVMRSGSVVRGAPSKDGTHGEIDKVRTKEKARRVLNGKEGITIFPRRRSQNGGTQRPQDDLWSKISDDDKQLISMNLLEKSGLSGNRQERDANLLRVSIEEACRYLKADDLDSCLDKHFGLDRQNTQNSADGCTIAALLLMNAMMLHQRIAVGKWLPGLKTMDALKASPNAKDQFSGQWNKITRHDFHPVFVPALDVIGVIVEENGRLAGLNMALKHLATEAERIAESYADMGSDHAGPLFNKVMGNQSSDGAFFTRPPAASLLAKLTLDVANEGGVPDWTNETTWRAHRSVDLACGSGTLIAALMTDMKRRASEQGATSNQLGDFQKLAVEALIAGLDMNPVSLQLAAAQMMAGAKQIKYQKMQLHQMPYGNDSDLGITVGTLELFGQKAILPRHDLGFDDERLGARQMLLGGEEDRSAKDEQLETELEKAVEAVKDVRIVIMNPPFTNRTKMGERFDEDIREDMRRRIDAFSRRLVASDASMNGVANENSIRPMFVALAEKCLSEQGVLAMVNPTIALTGPSGLRERQFLAERYYIHTLLTCHLPGQINLSQNTAINESIIIAKRHDGVKKPPTRIINLDKFPLNEGQVEEFHKSLLECKTGLISNGWGQVSEWPWERVKEGDWSAAIWRSPQLAEETIALACDERLISLGNLELTPAYTGKLGGDFLAATKREIDSFPILKSKGSDAQRRICGIPDEHRKPKTPNLPRNIGEGVDHPDTQRLMKKAGYLLVTAGQDSRAARLTSVVCEEPRVGIGWLPIPSEKLNCQQAKGLSVFLNSTLGRLQIMRNAGRKLEFPQYNPAVYYQVRVPDISDPRVLDTLVKCWEATKEMDVPQYRHGEVDGEYNVRKLWDEAVAKVLDRGPNELAELRMLLHQEPTVRGLGINEYAAEVVFEGGLQGSIVATASLDKADEME